jgi:phosphoglycolate phosphatase
MGHSWAIHRPFAQGIREMHTVIFDLDGTLADTSGDLLAAANACFHLMGHGHVLTETQDAGVALRGARAMLRCGLTRLHGIADETVIDQYFPILLSAYDQNISRHSKMYPGAMQAVRELSARGYGVGICTNKPAGLAEKLMINLGVRDEFASLVGADTLPVRKPDPAPLFEAARRAGGDPAKTLLVGDTDTDRNTARAANVPSILVTFGPSGDDMAALAPDALLNSFDDLPDIVDRLFA